MPSAVSICHKSNKYLVISRILFSSLSATAGDGYLLSFSPLFDHPFTSVSSNRLFLMALGLSCSGVIDARKDEHLDLMRQPELRYQ
jgi:hypothetical protein|tara:strand:- start:271 stop:528 length:258 start_codon:yes stop_codon:yes gene_type:complete